jgi:hypothetical protein
MQNRTVTLDDSNRLALDYISSAREFLQFDFPLIDIHSHIRSARAARIYNEAAQAFGIGHTVSMTPLSAVDEVRNVLGERVSFIAMPSFHSEMTPAEFKSNFLYEMNEFRAKGIKIVKFWCPPRLSETSLNQSSGPLLIDSDLMTSLMEEAASHNMSFMVHVADPDTWFATKYCDVKKYGTKEAHLDALRKVLDRFKVPVIAAHMAGSPEDLDVLSSLLEDHSNLHLDTSATRWMVRELSKHDKFHFLAFMRRWKERIAFGSDIVTVESGLDHYGERTLYCSRYWAFRTLFETDYDGESPISDPDLLLNEGNNCTAIPPVPLLKGKNLPPDILKAIYCNTAKHLIEET